MPDSHNWDPVDVVTGKRYFVMEKDSSFHSLEDRNPEYFLTENIDTVYGLTNNLSVNEKWHKDNLWLLVHAHKHLHFLKNKEQIAIVKDHQPIAYLFQQGNIFIHKNQLLVANKEQLTIISLKDILASY